MSSSVQHIYDLNANFLDIIWFQRYDPGKGLRKYPATPNHLANYTGDIACGTRIAYPDLRLQVSGNYRDPNASHIRVDCFKCRAWIETHFPELKETRNALSR